MYRLTIEYPETLPDAVGSTPEQFEQEAKWAMAVKLFELKRLSSGMAAALIGVDRVTFLLKLADYGVPMIDLTEAELLSDAAAVGKTHQPLDLTNSAFVGMWKDRPDMEDSTDWVRRRRQ